MILSHPSWVCGLKPGTVDAEQREYYVTPFVGVWIETWIVIFAEDIAESHPSWVCGLKLSAIECRGKKEGVTPFVGVWIETLNLPPLLCATNVTPFVGVWIETISSCCRCNRSSCHTLRGCVD